MNALPEPPPPAGWVLYDADCPVCQSAVRRFAPTLRRRGFQPEPLQSPWVGAHLGLSRRSLLREMRVLTPNGSSIGGADGLLYLAAHIWWAKPLAWMGRLRLGRALLSAAYRRVAEHRYCGFAECRLPLRPHHGSSAFYTMP